MATTTAQAAAYEDVLRRSFTWRYEAGQDVWTTEDALHRVAALAVAAMDERGSRHILDIGIGNGAHADAILARPERRLTGIDIVTPPIWPDLAARHGERITLVETDFAAFSPDETAFDVILDMGCFHHQEEAAHLGYLTKVASLLAPNGLFVLCVYGAEQTSAPMTQESTDHGRLSFRFTPSGLSERLAAAGLAARSFERVERPALKEHYLIALAEPSGTRS